MTIPSCGRRTTGRPSARYMRSCWARGVWALGPTSGLERSGTIHRCASTWVLPPAGGSSGSSMRGTPRPSRKNSAPRPRRRRSGLTNNSLPGLPGLPSLPSPPAKSRSDRAVAVDREDWEDWGDWFLLYWWGRGRAMPALFETDNLIGTIVDDIQTVAEAKPVVVAFSGGLDSTTVAALAKQALGADRVLLVTVNMGIYNYRRGNEIVLEMAEQLGLQQKCLLGQYVQHRVQANGPACNRCTREIKLGMVKAVARGRLVLTGANRSDTWGKMGIKVCNGYYSPLLDLEKPQVRAIADALGLAVPKIGEHPGREGCKLKHLLKPLAAPEFHGQAVAEA